MIRITSVLLLVFSMSVVQANAATVEVNSVGDAARSGSASIGLCDTGNTILNPDSGSLVPECTLRAAIETINDQDSGALTTITFVSWIEINDPVPGSSRWNPQTSLPPIEAPTHLDGTTHPLWSVQDGMPRVVIRGNLAPGSAIGLMVQGNGANSIIEGVTVMNFGNVGVEITTSSVILRQSHIGVDVQGLFDFPNAVGVVVSGDGNQVGHGGVPAVGTLWPNVISANTFTGLVVSGDDNLIAGNLIGVNKNGNVPLGNGTGVLIAGGGVNGNRLGDFITPEVGPGVPGRNVISGNVNVQVEISESATRAQVACNHIGANAEGNGIIAGNTLLLEVLGPLATVGTLSCPNLFAGGRTRIGRGGGQSISVTATVFAHNYVGVNQAGDNLGVGEELVQAINGSDLSIRDNTIGNGLAGIVIGSQVSGSNVVRNHVGTDAQGRELPLIGAGIFSNGTSIEIGTTNPSDHNVVGASEIGIVLGSDSQLNSVHGNVVGTNTDGDNLGNQIGMLVNGSEHVIGAFGTGNIIAFSNGGGSGNAARGIDLHEDSSSNLVRHNLIGVGPDGETMGLTDSSGDWIGHGISVAGEGHIIESNRIGHKDTAIHVGDGSSHVLQLNQIGTGDQGESFPNSRYGIRLQASGSRVLDNLIGNSRRGIRVHVNAFGTVIGNNYIGVTPDGDGIGNNLYGIYTTANTTRIGVDLDGTALPNIIGFNNHGVRAGGSNGLVQFNYIGMLPNSNLAPNSGSGLIILDQAANLDIGAPTGRRNYIAGNGGHGIEIRVGGSIRIWLNWIGNLPNGIGAGNSGDGIHIGAGVSNVTISGMGTNFNTGLLVRNNAGRGIALDPDAGSNNLIRRVIFVGNGGKAIDLGPGGRDQDPGDFDTGPNNLQNFPEFDLKASGYNPETDQIDMRVRLDSDPNGPTSYPVTVEVYRVAIADPGNPQPVWYLGSFEVPETRAQTFYDVNLDPLPAGPLTEETWFAATATDATGNGNTSELSNPFGGPQEIYAVGGTIANLSGEGLVLQNNGEDDLVITGNGGLSFEFSQLLSNGAPFAVTVASQPSGQHCAIENGTGHIDDQSAMDIAVTCCDLGDSIFHSRFQTEGAVPMCPISGVQQISSGETHSCAISSETELWCWGRNLNGRLGIGETEDEIYPPTPVIDEAGVPFSGMVQVDAGFWHSCAMKDDGSAWCWGHAFSGQIGDGGATHFHRYHPQRVVFGDDLEPLENVVQISVGHWHSCARQADGSAWCWGRQLDGRLGNGQSDSASVNRAVRVLREDTGEPLLDVTDIDAGSRGSCAVTDSGALWCWGHNEFGTVGDGTFTLRASAVRVIESGSENFVEDAESVSVHRHACAKRTSGTVWCWGHGESGQLGDGNWVNRNLAVQATYSDTEQAIVGALQLEVGINSDAHTCMVDADGQAWCWGNGGSGKLGVGNLTQSFSRARRVQRLDNLQNLDTVAKIASGRLHTCALTSGRVIMCWGSNSFGQIPREQVGDIFARAVYGMGRR